MDSVLQYPDAHDLDISALRFEFDLEKLGFAGPTGAMPGGKDAD